LGGDAINGSGQVTGWANTALVVLATMLSSPVPMVQCWIWAPWVD
jgi:hypothetical protein